MDQEINDRGILVDQQLVENAVLCDNQYRQMVTARAYELTGLYNPNSPAQIKGWLSEHGVEAEKLDKKTVKGLISETDGEVLEVLKLRLLMAKTSVKKYEAMSDPSAQMAGCMDCSNFTGQTARGAGPDVWCRCKTSPEPIPGSGTCPQSGKKSSDLKIWICYTTLPPEVLSELIGRPLYQSMDAGYRSRFFSN